MSKTSVMYIIPQAHSADIFGGLDEQYQHECMDQEQVELEAVANFRSGNVDNPSHNLKCFNRCVLEKMGVIREGNFMDAKVTEIFNKNQNKDDALHVYNECKSLKGENDCDTAFKLSVCLNKGIPI